MKSNYILIAPAIFFILITAGCSDSGDGGAERSSADNNAAEAVPFELNKSEWKNDKGYILTKVTGAAGDEILFTDLKNQQLVLGLFKLEESNSQILRIDLSTPPCAIRAIRLADGTTKNIEVRNTTGRCED